MGKGCSCKVAHLVLVGTSTLRNFAGALTRCFERGDCSALGLSPMEARELYEDARVCLEAAVKGGDSEACKTLITSGNPVFKVLVDFIAINPRRASAELNSMYNVLERGCSGVEKVVLYSTDTHVGEASARAVESYIKSRCEGLEVEVKRVDELGVSPRLLWKGLARLAVEVKRTAEDLQRRGVAVALNLTGGFKPEGGFALITSFPWIHAVYYVHESFREVVVIPALTVEDVKLIVESGALRGNIIDLEGASKAIPKASTRLCMIANAIKSIAPELVEECECSCLTEDKRGVIRISPHLSGLLIDVASA